MTSLRICACLNTYVGGNYEVTWFTTNDLSEFISTAKSLANRPGPCPYPDAFTYVPHLHSFDNNNSERFSNRFSTIDLSSDSTHAHCDFFDGHYTFPSSVAAVGQSIYSVGNVAIPEGLGFDMGPDLLCPRKNPALVVISDRIFVIADNIAKSAHAPFVELFDPLTSSRIYIAEPPFSHCSRSMGFWRNWMVAPLLGDTGEEKILVMSNQPTPEFGQVMHTYDVKTHVWEEFDDTDDLLVDNFRNLIGDPVAVAKDNAFYWLTSNRGVGRIYYYNWKTKQLLHVVIIDGFNFDRQFYEFNAGYKVLLHLEDDLFGLVWPQSKCRPSTMLHLSILKISKTDSNLTARLIGCRRYIIPTKVDGVHDLCGAYLLRQPAANGQLQKQHAVKLEGEFDDKEE